MIHIDKLTDEDVGREVIYTTLHGEREAGRLSSWNHRFVFLRFKGPQGEACEPDQCHFPEGPKE